METAVQKNGQQNGIATKQTYKVPNFSDLVNMEVVNSKDKEFQILLNQSPPEKWIKRNKFAGNSLYLPIDKIEYLLATLFLEYRIEIKDYKQLANSVCAHIRLHLKSPITGKWTYQDGAGAAPLQTKEGAGAIDWNQIQTGAVQMALPMAVSYAIKDAAGNIGRLFGKDLNRKDVMDYIGLAKNYVNEDEFSEIKSKLDSCITEIEINKYYMSLDAETKSNKKVIELFASKKAEICQK